MQLLQGTLPARVIHDFPSLRLSFLNWVVLVIPGFSEVSVKIPDINLKFYLLATLEEECVYSSLSM